MEGVYMEEAMWREKRGTAQLTWESLKYNVMYCKCEVMKNTEDPESLFSQNPLFMVGPNRPNWKVHNFESSVQVERLFYCYLIFLATSFTYHQYRVGSICPCGLLVAGWQDSSELKCPFLGQSARQSHPPEKKSRFVPLRPGAAKSLYRRAGDFLLPSGSSRQEWREAEHNGLLIVRGLDDQPPKPDNFVSSVCNICVSCMSIIEHIWTSIKVGYFAVQFSVKITYIKWLVDSVLKWSFDFYKDYCPFSMEQDSIFLEPFLNLLSEIIYR